eukprot:TRINITY_DN827_c1_g1_i13.p3 TRINITY_DN827_c1_g1~~TRINITY_DN827_c1_g1_i13.p3  ORF type:complete len:119 (-),score=18.06 TRINITY_DN827_c1_g1_i13:317-673(-)
MLNNARKDFGRHSNAMPTSACHTEWQAWAERGTLYARAMDAAGLVVVCGEAAVKDVARLHRTPLAAAATRAPRQLLPPMSEVLMLCGVACGFELGQTDVAAQLDLRTHWRIMPSCTTI